MTLRTERITFATENSVKNLTRRSPDNDETCALIALVSGRAADHIYVNTSGNRAETGPNLKHPSDVPNVVDMD